MSPTDPKRRGLIDAVILKPQDGKLEIELRGDLAAILGLSENRKRRAFSAKEKALQNQDGCGDSQPALFAP
jgi:hypothetical protein